MKKSLGIYIKSTISEHAMSSMFSDTKSTFNQKKSIIVQETLEDIHI